MLVLNSSTSLSQSTHLGSSLCGSLLGSYRVSTKRWQSVTATRRGRERNLNLVLTDRFRSDRLLLRWYFDDWLHRSSSTAPRGTSSGL